MTEEWCRQKLNSLQIKENRITTLNEIRDRLGDLSEIETTVTGNILGSLDLMDCLNEEHESEQSKLTQDILAICMSTLDLDRRESSSILCKCLSSENSRLKSIALNEIARLLRKNSSTTILDKDLVILIIGCINEHETNVGAVAVNILSRILIDTYDETEVKEAFLKILDEPDVVKCRVYEIAVNLAKSSPSALVKVEPVLDKLLSDVDGDDILLQLNVLELLVNLAEQNHGLIFLENRSLFKKINKRVEEVNQNPLDRLLIPGFMKFFGKIAYSQPQKIIEGYPLMVQSLFECFLSGDVTVLPTAFDTLGNVVHSSQGKILLQQNYGAKLKEVFEEFRSYLTNLPTDLKNRGFNALEMIFKIEGEIAPHISDIMKIWCRHLSGSDNLQYLLEFCKNPFPDIKVSCLSFIKTLCSYKWGINALRDTAGFVEYLLDRRVEFDKDARFVKYEIISILAESNAFDVQTMLQLKKYIEEGVHYVEGIVEIAVDGS